MLDKKVAYKDKDKPQSVLLKDIPATVPMLEEQDSSSKIGKKSSVSTTENNQSHHSSFNNNMQFMSNGNHKVVDSPPIQYPTSKSTSKTKTKTRNESYLIKDEDSPSSSEESCDYEDEFEADNEYLDDDDNNDIPIIPGIVLNGSDVDSAFEDKGLEDANRSSERRGTNKNMKKRPNYYHRNRDNHKESGSSVASSVSYPSGDKLRRSQMDIMDLEIEPISKLVLTPEDESNPRTHWLLSPDPTQFNIEISPSRSMKTKIFHNGDASIFNEETEKIVLEVGANSGEMEGISKDKCADTKNSAINRNSEPRFSTHSLSRKNDQEQERSRNCSDLEIEEYDVELVAPDGGWGWMVLFGSIIVNFLIPGMVKSFGVLFAEFLEVFDASPSSASWIPAISYCLYSSMGLFASALAVRFSERKVTMVGGILASAGLMSSYFATSITYLYISYGLIGGLGAGLAYPIGIFIVGKYFDKKRGLANGLCTSGSALGSVLIPPLLRYLLNQYGYRGAILIMGAILLNVCIGALFYSPVEKHMKKVLVPRLKRASIIEHPQIEEPETKKNFSNNIEIRKVYSDSRFFGNREIAQSMPIAIPLPLQNLDNREIRNRRESDNIRRATFQIGHDTPQDSWVTPEDHKISTKSCEDTTSPLIARMIRENTTNDYSPKIPNRITTSTNNNISLTNNTTGESGCESIVDDGVGVGTGNGSIPTTNPFTSNSMDKGQSGGGQSRQNLTAIPEDEDSESDSKQVSSSFYNAHSLSAVNGQKPLRLSMSGGGIQMMFASANQSGLSRTLSVASNVSNSSFHYISTIHHGGVLSAMNLDKNLSEFTSTLNLRSQRRIDQLDESLEAETKSVPRMKILDLIKSIVDFSLFHDGMYIIMLLSNSMTAVGYTNFIILLPAYALTMGFDKEKATLLLSVVAAFDFVGRIGGGIFSDLQYFPRKWFYILGLFFSGIVLAFIPLAKSYSTLVTFCACFGLASGIYIGVTAVILADFLGPEKLGSSYGITLFINGILQLIGPPVCGNLLSIIPYEPILSGLGVILVIGSFFWIASPFVEQNRMRNISTNECAKRIETTYA